MPCPVLRVSFGVRCQLLAELAALTAGAAVFCRWLALPISLFWVAGSGLAAGALVWVWTGRTLLCQPGGLILQGSFWFDTRRILPRRTMLGLFSFAPPLLRLAGCRVVVLATFTGRVWLPGLSRADTRLFLEWYQKTD